MYVTLLLDVEDIVTPEADDITGRIAEALTEEGVAATFCLVGERVRQWSARGRSDVIEALRRHDVGVHTDLHSVHPTVIEYLQARDWADGVEEAMRREAPAVEAVDAAFGCAPSCWGGPGNSWGPQVTEAMTRLEVPAIVYAHTRAPGGDVHRFMGALAYPCGYHAGDGEYHLPEAAQRNRQSLMASLRQDVARGRQWAEVFLGHPSRILHHEFWDGCNFALGVNPDGGGRKLPRRKTEHELQTALGSLVSVVRAILAEPGIELATIRQMNARFAEAREEPLSATELESVQDAIESNIRDMAHWIILPRDVSVDDIWLQTSARLATLRRLVLPSSS